MDFEAQLQVVTKSPAPSSTGPDNLGALKTGGCRGPTHRGTRDGLRRSRTLLRRFLDPLVIGASQKPVYGTSL